jgi:hypothetical protein
MWSSISGGFTRPDGALQGLVGNVAAALRDPLTSDRVLLEVFEDPVHDFDRDILEPGDGLCDLLDLVVGEVFDHLAGRLLAEGDPRNGYSSPPPPSSISVTALRA